MVSSHSTPLEAELDNQLRLAWQLVYRLERLSADSIWTRRASGYRASLLKSIERLERLSPQALAAESLKPDVQHLSLLVQQGYLILDYAARELVAGRRITRQNRK